MLLTENFKPWRFLRTDRSIHYDFGDIHADGELKCDGDGRFDEALDHEAGAVITDQILHAVTIHADPVAMHPRLQATATEIDGHFIGW